MEEIESGDVGDGKGDVRREAASRDGGAVGRNGSRPQDTQARHDTQWSGMPRFKLTIEYAGTRYSGWQIQKNARTVQGELDRAIRGVTGRDRFELYGSGRTDAGVHALAQVAHLDIATTLPPQTLLTRINDELPADINVLQLVTTSHRFHARHSARSRAYVYQIARRRTAFAKPFVWWIRETLDVPAMREAAALFAGFQDFQSFTDDDPDEKSTTVQVEQVEIVEDGALLLVRVAGSHFLWKMVRRIVGVLAAVGRGELRPDAVRHFLTQSSEIPARLTAPASGLFLESVDYGDSPSASSPAPASASAPARGPILRLP
jgi:tRNA pseudouridine38-40 synthase